MPRKPSKQILELAHKELDPKDVKDDDILRQVSGREIFLGKYSFFREIAVFGRR